MDRSEAIKKYGKADNRGHVTRFSDSSIYDDKCVLCGMIDSSFYGDENNNMLNDCSVK